MVSQSLETVAPVVMAAAENVPIPSGWADLTMTLLSLHHWTDWRASISEMRRLAPRGLVLTYVPELHASYWLLRDYLRRSLYLRERDLLELRTLRSKSPGTASMACFRSTSGLSLN